MEKDDYVVISTPDLPFYHWGNFLMYPDAPEAGSLQEWTSAFQLEFKGSGCNHTAFVWDSPSGEYGESKAFEDDGFYFEFDEILTATTAERAEFYNEEIEVRTFDTSSDWEQRVDLNLACQTTMNSKELAELGAHYRRDSEKGNNIFLGAFLNDGLIGELGVFKGGKTKGIIGIVKTHPNFRRRGVCQTLVIEAVEVGKRQLDLEEFVMVADKGYSSASVYKAVGFKVVEHGACLLKTN